jgi:squalene-hopene/tetraprenyl-beta-curcumene cyclase
MQDEKGAWMSDARAVPTNRPDAPSPVAVAVSALVLKAVVQAEPDAVDKPEFRKAMALIDRGRNEDGSYEGGSLTNYVTSTVVSALAAIDGAEHSKAISGATDWLQQAQWDESEGLTKRQDWYGGAGYGNSARPDLSNTQMMLDALYDAGLSPDEPAFQRALVFLGRTQNLESVNNANWAGDDGGFVYTSANGGESMASQAAGEGRRGENLPPDARSLRSYGSMTYAGFKSLLYAGLSPEDPRVKAAFNWIRRHFTFDENPGMGQQGLYYYYHAMARALRVARQPLITDEDGRSRNWREELIDALAERQRKDGTWLNEADRWLEGHPALVTAYAVLALQETIKPVDPSARNESSSADPAAR